MGRGGTMSWTSAQRLKLNSTRLRPALDLLKRAAEMTADPALVKSVLDLGCGPGNVTPFLCETFPNAKIFGVDRNIETVQKARTINEKSVYADRIAFNAVTIETFANAPAEKYDVVFCNSALHWCADHDELIPKIIKSMVACNGGVLAIQMPDTRVQVSHLLMETAALRTGLEKHLKEVRIPRVERDPSWYFDVVSPATKDVDIWNSDYIQQLETTYAQEIASDFHPVLEFARGAGLDGVIAALGGAKSDKGIRFLREYDRLLHDQYPTVTVKNPYHTQGKLVTLMPFKRFFLVCKT